jgi:hypothetical protein
MAKEPVPPRLVEIADRLGISWAYFLDRYMLPALQQIPDSFSYHERVYLATILHRRGQRRDKK